MSEQYNTPEARIEALSVVVSNMVAREQVETVGRDAARELTRYCEANGYKGNSCQVSGNAVWAEPRTSDTDALEARGYELIRGINPYYNLWRGVVSNEVVTCNSGVVQDLIEPNEYGLYYSCTLPKNPATSNKFVSMPATPRLFLEAAGATLRPIPKLPPSPKPPEEPVPQILKLQKASDKIARVLDSSMFYRMPHALQIERVDALLEEAGTESNMRDVSMLGNAEHVYVPTPNGDGDYVYHKQRIGDMVEGDVSDVLRILDYDRLQLARASAENRLGRAATGICLYLEPPASSGLAEISGADDRHVLLPLSGQITTVVFEPSSQIDVILDSVKGGTQ